MNRAIDDSDPDFEIITDRHGRKVKVLRDGHTARVRFRDAQAVRAQPVHDGRQPLTDQDRRELRGCRPGYRVIVDSAGHAERRAQVDAAYAESEAAMCASWKRPWPGLGAVRDGNGVNGVGSHGVRGQVEGSACTVNGQPGTLQRRNGQLQCVADDEDDRDIDEIFDAAQGGVDPVEAARRAYLYDLTHAWKRG
jgi:hypothetical protein